MKRKRGRAKKVRGNYRRIRKGGALSCEMREVSLVRKTTDIRSGRHKKS